MRLASIPGRLSISADSQFAESILPNPSLPNIVKERYLDSFGLKYCWKSDLFLFLK